jgi:hypothetical protein
MNLLPDSFVEVLVGKIASRSAMGDLEVDDRSVDRLRFKYSWFRLRLRASASRVGVILRMSFSRNMLRSPGFDRSLIVAACLTTFNPSEETLETLV